MARKDSLDLRVLGVRCVSGLDKLEFALVRYRQDSPDAPLYLEMLQSHEQAVPPSTRDPILNVLREAHKRPNAASHMNRHIGDLFADGISDFCSRKGIPTDSIDCVGSHTPNISRIRSSPTTKICDHALDWNSHIRDRTSLTAISNFAMTQAKGWTLQASPVAHAFATFLRHPHKFRVCLNIGELVNISFLPPNTDGVAQATMSQDCGPGTIFIDYAMRYCTSNQQSADREGKFAAKGTVNQSIVDRFLATHDYLHTTPSLHMAREMFGDHEAQRLIDECVFVRMSDVDTVATMTRVTAQNILVQYRRLLAALVPPGQQVDELFICGSGAHNACIVDFLEDELPESIVTRPLGDVGLPADANDALCYAHLAFEVLLRQGTQGPGEAARTPEDAGGEVVRGGISRGRNWDVVSERLLLFSNGDALRVPQQVRMQGREDNDAQ